MANYHVTKKGGNWGARQEGVERASGLYPTQDEAEKAAKDFAGRSGGGEVRIHRPDGRIRDSDTIPPAKDPFPPRDTKH